MAGGAGSPVPAEGFALEELLSVFPVGAALVLAGEASDEDDNEDED